MDFFEHQDQARRRTVWLVLLYALAVAGIVLALYLAMLLIMGVSASESPAQPVEWWQPDMLTWVALGVGLAVFGGTVFKTVQLSKGGEVVAKSLGGHPVAPDTTDPDERKLLNVVEEMALAAGIPVPSVFLLGGEDGINAFAAGFTQRDAVIGVTRGCMRNLSRDELQGVIAHEFSHIVNGDMRLNIRLMGVLFGILMLTVIGRILLRSVFFSGGRSRRSDKRGGNPLPLIGLALILVGYIGVFFAFLIKSAVSRQREFLSDASAVQYTRNPDGIAGALKKIAGYGAKIKSPHATEASHLFFGQALGTGFFQMFSTHPPIEKRIARLDPAFNPQIAAIMSAAGDTGATAAAGASGFAGGNAPASGRDFGQVNLAAGGDLFHRIPAELKTAAHDPTGARGLVYAILSARQGALQKRTLDLMSADSAGLEKCRALFHPVRGLPVELHLPLIEIAIRALCAQKKADYKTFRKVLHDLVAADNQVDLFEYALEGMIGRHVSPAFEKPASVPVRYHKPDSVLEPCSVILRALAVWGTESRESANACYVKGMDLLGVTPAERPVSPEPTLAEVDAALKKLQRASPKLKRDILNACRECVLADGRTGPRQYELLRAIADALDVPMPPLPLK